MKSILKLVLGAFLIVPILLFILVFLMPIESAGTGNDISSGVGKLLLLALIAIVWFIAYTVFSIWMSVDMARSKLSGGAKVAWALAMFFLTFPAAIIWFFIRKDYKRRR